MAIDAKNLVPVGNGSIDASLLVPYSSSVDVSSLVPLNDEGTENNKIDLDVIENNESSGNNNAVSKTGAKGILQFEPATSREYSKRLFGHEVSDASTLSLQQQKEMANAYFNDLLKEFHGNTNQAVAAYNEGQGNVEKDIQEAKDHGGEWLDYAPKETRDYVHKYDAMTEGNYDHKSKGGDAHWMPSIDDMKSTMSTQFEQIKDLSAGATAEARKLFGMSYDQGDIDEMKAELGSNEGKALRTETAVAASVVAPELAPEITGIEGAGALTWLGKGLAGSLAYQGVANGDLTLKQTAEDLAMGAGAEAGLKFLAAPAIKQVSGALGKFLLSNKSNPELTSKIEEYLAAGRAEEVGHNWKYLREENPKATMLDAYKSMHEQVPELFKSEKAINDIKALTRKYKNTGSHSQMIDDMRSLKNEKLAEAKVLAKSDAEQRLIQTIEEATTAAKGNINISDDVMTSTPLQKAGEKAADWFGVNMPKSVRAAISAKQLEPEAKEVKKLLQGDNARIGRELKKQAKRPAGASTKRKIDALTKQRTLNRKMIQFIDDGLQGKKVKVADIAEAIKEVQEDQFNRGKFKGVTSRFKSLADKFEVMQVHKLAKDSSIAGQVAESAIKKGSHHVITKAMGIGVTPLMVGSTVAGKLAQISKVSNLRFASELAKMVEAGDLTEEQAERLIVDKFKAKAELARLFAPAVSNSL
ncbi:transglycosylase SLT domain-containing protein [Klebsiella variicola]|uniref:transglycosylase SLT domain-containing protein n=1 Tax=Klebsiella variicola TaxID=244366 RepID=UPI003D061273